MIKKILILLIITSTISSFAQNSKGVINTENTNVRWKASTNSNVIKQYPKGKEIVILQKKGKWYFIQNPVDGTKGWVHQYLISIIYNRGILTAKANVRWKASRNSNVIKQYPKGKEIVILQKKGKWYFIQNPVDGTKGWVHVSLISKDVNAVTKVINTAPNCDYKIISPGNGDKNVKINPTTIKWKHGTGSPSGYYFSIGKISSGKVIYVKNKDGKLIENIDIGYVSSYSISNLESNTQYFISLIPYNKIGKAKNCDGLFSFTTGSSTGSNLNSVTTSKQIIEKRLTNKGISWRWKNFNKTKLKSIHMSNTQRKNFIDEVLSWEGVPYDYGGTSRGGVDCSGLIWRGLRQAINYNGEKLNAQGWAQSGKLIANKSELIKGDLVCFFISPKANNRLVQHIAIYIGNGKFWHSPSSGGRVTEASLENSYWKPKFIFGVRY